MATKTPPGLKTAGRRLWRSITDDFELAEHEKALLLQACSCADRLDELARGMEGEPLTVSNARGDEVAHPILVESRQQAITLSRLLASLRIPDADDVRPQRRGAARGSYGLRSVV